MTTKESLTVNRQTDWQAAAGWQLAEGGNAVRRGGPSGVNQLIDDAISLGRVFITQQSSLHHTISPRHTGTRCIPSL